MSGLKFKIFTNKLSSSLILIRIITENISMPIKLFPIKNDIINRINKTKIIKFISLDFILMRSFRLKIVAPKKMKNNTL